MSLLEISSATAQTIPIVISDDLIAISVTGNAPTSGWENITLSPWFHITEPSDGIWDIDLTAREPTGMVLNVIQPFSTQGVFVKPKWLKGLRIHGKNAYDVNISANKNNDWKRAKKATNNKGTKSIITQQLASYDDSFQPTGTIHWDGWTPHPEMKKLHHDVVIIVEGGDENTVRDCLNKAFTDALLAAILAALISGGMAAAGAFLSTGVDSLTRCIGSEAINVRIIDNSHWVYWDV